MSNFKPHPIGRFPFWADADAATETEAVDHHGGPHSAGGELIEYRGGEVPEALYAHRSQFLHDGKPITFNGPGAGPDLVGEPVGPVASGGGPFLPGESWAVKEPSEVPINSGDQSPVAIYARLRSLPNAGKPQTFYSPGAGGEAPVGEPVESVARGEAPGPIGNFAYSRAVEPGFGETDESILKESGMDGLRESDSQTAAADSLIGPDESTGNFTSTVRRFFSQSDSLTGDELANADTDSSPSWFHMHHDDGINDGYLDVDSSAFDSITGAQPDDVIHTPNGSIITGLNPDDVVHVNASSFDSFLLQNGPDLAAPADALFAEAASITDFVTGKSGVQESGMDGLVAAGPLDAVKVDEPRNNDF